MENDYIGRQGAIKAIQQAVIKGYGSDYGVIDSDVVYEILDDLPAADVVPVVRCRNCARLNRNGYCTRFQNNISGIATSWFMPDDDDFCSYGKRKDGVK